MMDIFHEFIVKKKNTAKDYLLVVGIFAAALVLTMVLFTLSMMIKGAGGIGLVLIFALWWGVKVLVGMRSVEYEYILTNNELDVDKIMGRRGRKRLLTVNFREIDRCASIHDEKYSYEYNNSANRSVLNYAGDMEAQRVYFVDFSKDAAPTRLIFQPNERILQGLKQANPRLVEIREGDV